MMRLLLDDSAVLAILNEEKDPVAYLTALFNEKHQIECWLASTTAFEIYRRLAHEPDKLDQFKELLEHIPIVPVGHTIFQQISGPDVDAQIFSQVVVRYGLDGIVTDARERFRSVDFPVWTLKELEQGLETEEISGVPFLDLRAQLHTLYDEIGEGLDEVIFSSRFVLGDHVARFEENFASYCQAEHCVAVSSGTAALHAALAACGVGQGDEVITVPNTFIATVEAISLVGANPVFVDISSSTYTLDPDQLEQAITPATRAIIPVHLYGHPADMDPILDIAARHGLIVIEDAAQAHGAMYRGKRIGSLGHIACFSFYPGKNLGAYGEGGAVVTNDESLAQKVRMFRDHGQAEKYHHEFEGHNYRMDAFQGVVLNAKLKYLDQWNAQRRSHAALYGSFLKNCPDIVLPEEAPDVNHVYHLYVILHERRDALRDFLQQRGIASGLHYPIPLHLQSAYRRLGYKRGDFPVTEKCAERLLSLPMYPELTSKQVELVAEAILEFCDQV